jgi:MYXO-CTERM domain-containing protein
LLGATASAVVLAVSVPAAANGRFPASNALYFGPNDANLVVLRTTFGILPSHDYGNTWGWLCEDALGLPPTSNADPALALTANDTLVAGLPSPLGLEVSPDTGCSWSTIGGGLQGQFVKDVAVRPGAPDVIYALTSTYEPDAGTDGGAGYIQQVYSSSDDGAHWTLLGTIDPSAIVTTIDVAATDPQRIYVAAFRGAGTARTASLFVSVNGGQSWTERPTPFDSSHESAVYIAAVDPTNADRVYLRSEGASRLFVTVDAGQNFQIPLSFQDQMLGFALSQDGSKVFAGGPNVGLYSAAAADLQFQSVMQQLPDGGTHSIHVQCLATHGTDLWACSDEPSGFIAGYSQDDGVTFTPKLHLTTIQGAVQCGAGTTSYSCATTNFDADPPSNPFGSLCTNLGVCFDGGQQYPLTAACIDAGACGTGSSGSGGSGGSSSGGSGGGGDGGTTPGASKSSCGCTVVGGGGAAGALAATALLLLTARRRRSR